MAFLSTLSLRRATHKKIQNAGACLFLSTLSLRRATLSSRPATVHTWKFLSTLSLRRATLSKTIPRGGHINFYPRSPCGERQRAEIHASTQQEFLSTLSLRRATPVVPAELVTLVFLSTLSLRRATIKPIFSKINTRDFYPRSPCGERPHKSASSLPS